MLLVVISYVHLYQYVSRKRNINKCTFNINVYFFVGRPKAIYANPCEIGAPLTHEISGAPLACALRSENGIVCPLNYECTSVAGSTQSVCCPVMDAETTEMSQDYSEIESRPQTSK